MPRKRQRRRRTRPAPDARRARDWPRLAGEAALIAVILAVSLLIYPRSKSLLDVKDFALGIGVALGLSVWLVASLARGRIEWAPGRLNVGVAAFTAWAGLSLIYSGYRYATVSEVGRLAAHVGLYGLVILAIRDARQVRRLLGTAAIAALLVCAYALVQAAGADPVSWDQKSRRVFSFLGNPTYLAGYLVLLMPLVAAAGWPTPEERGARSGLSRWFRPSFFLLTAGLMLLCLYLTVSLSPIIGLGLGTMLALALAIVKGRRHLTARTVIPFLIAGVLAAALFTVVSLHLPKTQQQRILTVLGLKDPYGKERSLIRRVGIDIFREHPVLGTGYGTYRIHSLERLAPGWYADLGKSTRRMLVPNYAHNEYIQVLAGTGVVGGAIFFALLGLAYWLAVRVALRHPSPDWARLGFAVLAGMSAFLFQNFFGVTFRQPGTVTFFWLSIGLLTVAGAGLRRTGEQQPPDPEVRQWRFRRPSVGLLALVALASAAVVLVLGWVLANTVNAGVLVRRAEAAAKRGRFEAAAALAEQAVKANPYSVLAYYVAAYAWGNLGDHEKSLEANKKALSLLPGNASVYYNLGVTYKELGRFDEARESFERAIELMPTSDRHHAAMAELLLEAGRPEEALPYAREAVRLSPRDPRCYLLLADITRRQGKIEETLKLLREAGALAPRDARVWRRYAELSVGQRQYSEALEACKAWIRAEPTSAAAYSLLGMCYYNTQQFPAARTAFERALEIDPSHRDARLGLAYAYGKLRDGEAMNRELRRLVETAPETRQGRAARRLLERRGAGSAR